MTPEERALKCYQELWAGNGTHSEEFVIAGIAKAIREAEAEYSALYDSTAKLLNSANHKLSQIKGLVVANMNAKGNE